MFQKGFKSKLEKKYCITSSERFGNPANLGCRLSIPIYGLLERNNSRNPDPAESPRSLSVRGIQYYRVTSFRFEKVFGTSNEVE